MIDPPVEIQGEFWLQDEPGNRASGRLVAGGSEPPRLFIAAGSLVEDAPGFGKPRRIHGKSISSELTLDGCRLIGGLWGWFTTDQVFSVETVVSGATFKDCEELAFRSVQFRLNFLEDWLGLTGVRWELGDVGPPNTCQFRFEPVGVPPYISAARRIDLCHGHSWRNNFQLRGISERWEIQITYPEVVALEKIEKDCVSVRNLIAIGCGASSHIYKLRCAPAMSKRVRIHKPGLQTIDSPAAVYAARYEHSSDTDRDRSRGLFNCDDIGGLESVGRWIENLESFEFTLDMLAKYWYEQDSSAAIRLFSVYTAAESFVRIDLRQQKLKKFNRHLVERANSCCSWFSTLLGDVGAWASMVVRVRHNQVVHGGLRGPGDNALIGKLCDSLYLLVVLMLLRESGCDDSELESLANSPQIHEWRADWQPGTWQ